MRVFLSLAGVLMVCVAVGCGDKSEKKDGKKDDAAAKSDSDAKKGDDTKKDGEKKDDTAEKKDPNSGDTQPTGDPNVIGLTAANTKVEFVGSKDDGKHNGGFKTISGTVQLGTSGPKSIDVMIETNSIWADDEKLQEHLKSDDFFGVNIFPKASIMTSKIEPSLDDDNATHTLTADLTMRGVTKTVTIPVKVEQSGGVFKLSGDFEISRKEFGFTYGADKIHDTVKIHVEVDTSSK